MPEGFLITAITLRVSSRTRAARALEQDLSFGFALFSESALIGYDLADYRGNPFKPLVTGGVSFRFLWNKTFAVRTDLATSGDEREGPGFYIIVNQAF